MEPAGLSSGMQPDIVSDRCQAFLDFWIIFGDVMEATHAVAVRPFWFGLVLYSHASISQRAKLFLLQKTCTFSVRTFTLVQNILPLFFFFLLLPPGPGRVPLLSTNLQCDQRTVWNLEPTVRLEATQICLTHQLLPHWGMFDWKLGSRGELPRIEASTCVYPLMLG